MIGLARPLRVCFRAVGGGHRGPGWVLGLGLDRVEELAGRLGVGVPDPPVEGEDVDVPGPCVPLDDLKVAAEVVDEERLLGPRPGPRPSE